MAKLSSSRIRKLITLILVVVGVFLVVNQFFLQPQKKKAAARKAFEQEQEKKKGKRDLIPIKVIEVIKHDFVDNLEALGTVKGGMEFKLTFPIPGTIESINYREGENYEKGALLMSLQDSDIILRMKRVEANQKKTQTTVDIAKQKLEEHEKLFKIGAISKTSLDKVRLELESAEYDLEAANLEVKANEAVLEKTNMFAVSDGMIGELYVEVGEVITSNTLVGSHILIEFVSVKFGVIERDMGKIKVGQNATIQVDAYPGQTFSGVVDGIAPVVGGSSRTADISIKVDNKEGLLSPGMFARIQVSLFSKRDALIVPTEAIGKTEHGENFVYTLNEEEGTVTKTPVKVGYSRTDYAQIDEGIEAGQMVATTSINRLDNDKKVDVIEKQTLEL